MTRESEHQNDRRNDSQHRRTVPWRRYWRIVKALLQIAAAQLIAWALKKWWG
jgi:hypothetical protein